MADHVTADGVEVHAATSPEEPSAAAGREEEAHGHHATDLPASHHAASGGEDWGCRF